MDPDSYNLAVCGGEGESAGPACSNPQNNKFGHVGLSVGGSRPFSSVVLLISVVDI